MTDGISDVWRAVREWSFARRVSKRLLRTHAEVRREKPDLLGTALYKEVLLRTSGVDAARADELLSEAEASVDKWTAKGRERLRFRELVHFVIMSEHQAAGHAGAIISFKKIVDRRVPPDL